MEGGFHTVGSFESNVCKSDNYFSQEAFKREVSFLKSEQQETQALLNTLYKEG